MITAMVQFVLASAIDTKLECEILAGGVYVGMNWITNLSTAISTSGNYYLSASGIYVSQTNVAVALSIGASATFSSGSITIKVPPSQSIQCVRIA